MRAECVVRCVLNRSSLSSINIFFFNNKLSKLCIKERSVIFSIRGEYVNSDKEVETNLI